MQSLNHWTARKVPTPTCKLPMPPAPWEWRTPSQHPVPKLASLPRSLGMVPPALWWFECMLCVLLERQSRAFLESPWREWGPSQSSEPLACVTSGPPLLWHPRAFQSPQSVPSSFLLGSVPQGSHLLSLLQAPGVLLQPMEVCVGRVLSPHPRASLSQSITSVHVLSPSLADRQHWATVLSCYLVLKLQSGGRLIIYGQVSVSVWQVWRRDEGCNPCRNLSPFSSSCSSSTGKRGASHPLPLHTSVYSTCGTTRCFPTDTRTRSLPGDQRQFNQRGPTVVFFNIYFCCAGSLLLLTDFLQLQRAGAPLCCSAQASHCGGFSDCRAQALKHGLSGSAACGSFPDQGSNPCPLHWQADS